MNETEEPPAHKIAIVTGASSGIGAAAASALARAGANLVLVGRDQVRLTRAEAAVRAAGRDALTVVVDVTEPGAPDRMVQRTVERYGAIDMIIHSAGSFLFKPAAETSSDDLDRLLDVHVRAPFALARAALPHLRRGSSLVFIGSNLAHYALPGTSAYAASKAAEEALARNLAVELAPRGVRVNSISPGVIKTAMTAHLQTPEATARVIAKIPLGRMGEPEDVAAAVTYLCSDAARHVTGTSLVIDGGAEAG
jgi:NAD(P)-dependent dehydrogenase (short-subunit alcohol dehydrogenase family)